MTLLLPQVLPLRPNRRNHRMPLTPLLPRLFMLLIQSLVRSLTLRPFQRRHHTYERRSAAKLLCELAASVCLWIGPAQLLELGEGLI